MSMLKDMTEVLDFAGKLGNLAETDAQEFNRVTGLARAALDRIVNGEHFQQELEQMPADIALAFCTFIIAVLTTSVNSKTPA